MTYPILTEPNKLPIAPEYLAAVHKLKEDLYQQFQNISHEKTPDVDGLGQEIIKTRPDGRRYIEDAWMRDRLNCHFPGWSLEMAAPLQFLAAEWVVGQVILIIPDASLLAFGINPPVRKYYAVDSVRIQYSANCRCIDTKTKKPNLNCLICKGSGKPPHTPEYIIDIGDNAQACITNAFKRAVNRLTGIGDDIYDKLVESNGAGNLEDVLIKANTAAAFGQWLTLHGLTITDAFKALSIKSLDDIDNAYTDAIDYIKRNKGWK